MRPKRFLIINWPWYKIKIRMKRKLIVSIIYEWQSDVTGVASLLAVETGWVIYVT